MSYTSAGTIFDFYIENGKVWGMNIAGRGFCLPHEICLDRRGNIGKLRRHYGEDVYVTTSEEGFDQYVMVGEFTGRPVVTRLLPHGVDGSINQVEIEWDEE